MAYADPAAPDRCRKTSPQTCTPWPCSVFESLAGGMRLCYNTILRPGGLCPASFRIPPPEGGSALSHGSSRPRTMKKGVPVSPGVAVAHAFCVDQVLARHEPYH